MNGVTLADMIEAGDCLDALLGLIERARNNPDLGVGADAVQAARVRWARTSAVYRAALHIDRKVVTT